MKEALRLVNWPKGAATHDCVTQDVDTTDVASRARNGIFSGDQAISAATAKAT